MMKAMTNDERLATGVDMIAENHNVKREKEAAECRAEFYKTLWEQAMRENDELRMEISELNRELIRKDSKYRRMMFSEYGRRLMGEILYRDVATVW